MPKDFHIMINACAVVNFCWPAIGRGVGCFLRCHLWDFAGSWPIIRRAGLDLRRISDGKVLDRLEADLFTREPLSWHMKEYYLISSERNFQQILSKIGRRDPLLKVHLGGINELGPTEIIHYERPAGFIRGTSEKNKIDDTVGFFMVPPSSPLRSIMTNMSDRFIRIYKKFLP